jgi:hypothetical protein
MENAPLLPPQTPPGTPSHQQQQWGVVISIAVIVLMVVVGAFYSWGKRIAQQEQLATPSAATE